MFQAAMSNSTLSEEAAILSRFSPLILQKGNNIITQTDQQPPPPPKKVKKKRSLPGNPDPNAEVIALSPKTLLATNRFICEICNKGFQRDQNLQLHRRGHNLPWKLKQRSNKDVIRKKAYVCPEPTCVHHNPSRALGDLTGIKKHFCRKHGEKKYKCEKCSKIYAVQSDWKAHSKTCGTREYRCDCGTLFSRKDSFITHRAFCDALAEESARISTNPILPPPPPPPQNPNNSPLFPSLSSCPSPWDPPPLNPNNHPIIIKTENNNPFSPPFIFQTPPVSLFTKGLTTSPQPPPPFTSATAFDRLNAVSRQVGPTTAAADVASGLPPPPPSSSSDDQYYYGDMMATWRKNKDGLTRDFLGLTAGDHYGNHVDVGAHHEEVAGNMLKFTGGLQYGMTAAYHRDNSSSSSLTMLNPHHHHHHNHNQVEGFGFVNASMESRWG